MGMRMSFNARCGSDFRKPNSAVLQALANPKSSLQVEFLLLCDRLNIPREKFEGWGDDELRGLTVEITEALGIPTPSACQLVAKVNGFVQRVAASAAAQAS
mmetsp:Transcript_151872/g.276354  ORF Transcript_151872/g.276354 Transcript_151872/m.276354 type:complete len:101 (+) Transcript_151872:71-373(+)